ncbi:MAG: GAF domain-containing protein [Candidatus Omnitrophica bacterium]|nr:GAF domain-containing protein [Candidatus Omnitrophota bacterium]
MSRYSLLPLISAILFLLLGSFVYLKSKGNRSIRLGFLFNSVVTFWWQFSWFFLFNTNNLELAKNIARIGHIGIVLIPATYLHYFTAFVDSRNFWRLTKKAYFVSLFFIILLPTNLLINGVNHFYWGYYPKAGILHPLFLLYLFTLMGMCFFQLLQKGFLIRWQGVLGSQLTFLLIAFFVYCLASTDFFVNYGFSFYPLGVVAILISLTISAYAIVRYRLMDIRVAISNTAIFIAVYSFVLGIPVWIGFKFLGKGAWLLPIGLMALFATLGPFIYLYVQKQAEDKLLQEQRRYQATLRQASAGMGKIKDLKKLLNMIVYVLTHAIQIEHASIYIHDKEKKQYFLGAIKRKSGHKQFLDKISENSSLIRYLLDDKNLVIYEEFKQKSQDFKGLTLGQVEEDISSLDGELIAPIFIEGSIIAIIVMGKKESGKIYTQDDISVFGILANQTALAIENAKFYEDMKLTQEQLFKAEKMATIGTMADGLSHQINNRFHALGFIAGDALDTIHLNQKEALSSEKSKEVMAELERALVRVQENVTQGGEIVQGLLKYTRKGETGFAAVDVDAVFKAALEMTQFKIKTQQLKIIREYDVATIPKIKANFTQVQEVFFNLIDNGYDAMMQRKDERREPDYQPTLIVRVFKEDGYVEIIFEDNGVGVKDEDMSKMFTPFFTTKLSSKKGTGLGLYVIRKIIEENHGGRVEMVSKYMHGTQMKLRLPIAIG